MTKLPSNGRSSDPRLLRLARALFDPAVLESVVVPTIADAQREIEAAGEHPLRRAAARLRGYATVAKLVVLAPLVGHTWPVRREAVMLEQQKRRNESGWLVLAGILAFTSPALTPWTGMTIAGGVIVAVVMHLWYVRHPSDIVTVDEVPARRPEINFSRMPVAGNIGGLIFMGGSMAILVAGLPSWRWFFAAAAGGGLLTAALVSVWHTSHPAAGLPQNRIVLR
jgi:hypothetical protein